MLLGYAGSMKSWMLMMLLLLGLIDTLVLLDRGVAVELWSIVYLNVLYLVTFILFFLWRFRRETRYFRELRALASDINDDWIEALPAPDYARDELVNQALRAADRFYKRKLAASNLALSMENDYIASWVHEIKAPLTAMKLTIAGCPRDPVMRRIEAEWLRVYLLIDRQLYMSRLPTLELDYVLESCGVRRMAMNEVRDLASWCIEKNIAVEFEGEETDVVTDMKWCRFIIRQLLMNAVKYSPEGGTIYIATEFLPAGHVMVRMTDEGPGIPAHDLPRIFDKGFTGGNGRIYNAATGLGLYLARSVADKIGVSIEAQSGRTEGTEMRMTFTCRNGFDAVRKGKMRLDALGNDSSRENVK
ncbi:two-component system, OmpR family, bacitracin resistance sensor histidine kinase BceS [Paenibacillus sp. UNC496MF]|uniref:sensor histidine kinase n=1 Tax=Paenibacillus sp. UNC496MF TaxID=1502753 RepID=UPI0008E89814|nr:sensor histidine kinase [Paenibacillus sp. UNC496MF]SFJ58978.1 two-component system, OmpR family, bacitracin resistance sensor histidine kinase BceS [Paenibacillus sp. UNC496MF]